MQAQSQITVDVPAGIHHGQTLRMRGQGEAGRQGAEAGDLYVVVLVREDKRFTRDGDNIKTEVTIPVFDAILGTEVNVETVHGRVSMRIAEGTQSGTVLRLKNKGMPVLSSSRFGDHYVTVQVEIPRKLSRAERKLVEEWKEISK